MVGTAAGDEPDVNAVGDHVLNGRRLRLGAVLLKEIEGSAGGGDRIHLGIGEESPAVPIGRSVHGADVGEADAEGIIEGSGCVESGITAGAASNGGEVVDDDSAFFCQLLKEMIGGDILFVHSRAAGTVAEEDDRIRMISFEVLENIGITQPVGGAVSPAIIEDKRGTGRDVRRNIKEPFGVPVDGTVGIGSVRFADQGIIK